MSPNALFLVYLPITVVAPAWLTYYVCKDWVAFIRKPALRQVAWWLFFVPLGGLGSLALVFWGEQDRVPLEWILAPGFRFLGYLLTAAPLLLLLDAIGATKGLSRRFRDVQRTRRLDVTADARPSPERPMGHRNRLELRDVARPGFERHTTLRRCVLVSSLLLCGWGEKVANLPPLVRAVELPLRHVPEAFVGYRILHLSDLHLRGRRDISRLESIVATANRTQPDLVAITGDLVDGPIDGLGRVFAPLSQLRAKDGVWFVLGNHEYYAGAEECVRELRRLGIQVLLDEHRTVRRGNASLIVSGVTNPQAGLHGSRLSLDRGPTAHLTGDPRAALRGAEVSRSALSLFLAHQPKSVVQARALPIDVALCGHTHGGQFFPYPWLARLVLPYVAGLYREGSVLVFASPGLGTFGPELRLGAPPEMTVLRLVPAANAR
jgi:predicted MPP superfamily phosphohydrolase